MKPLIAILWVCLLLCGNGCVAGGGYSYGYRAGYYVAPAPVIVAPRPYYYVPRARCYEVAPCTPDRMCCYDHWGNYAGPVTP